MFDFIAYVFAMLFIFSCALIIIAALLSDKNSSDRISINYSQPQTESTEQNEEDFYNEENEIDEETEEFLD